MYYKKILCCSLTKTISGTDATCAAPMARDGTMAVCNGGNNFCIDGVCAGSVCVRNQLDDCQCTEIETQRCHVCCVYNGVCTSTFDIMSTNSLITGQDREVGQSCNNLTGYCDSSLE